MTHLSESRRSTLMRQAELILRDDGLLELPVDVEGLAKTRDIGVEPIDGSDGGVSGMLARYGDTFGILYNASIPNKGYQRFSIAHELGHFFIEGHIDHILSDENAHKSRANFISNNCYEREADYFASGLLMPKPLIQGIVRKSPDGLQAVETIQKRAQASLTASAIRYAGIAELAAAIIVSKEGKVDYFFMSDALRSLDGLCWLRKGTPIPRETATASLVEGPDRYRPGVRHDGDTDIADWFEGERRIDAREEAVGLGSSGRALTILTCPEILDKGFVDEDEESDEAMEERWRPRFRR